MTNTLTPTELANTVSSFALIWPGLTALAFCRWVGGISGALNLAVSAFRALGGAAARHLTVIPLGEFGGFYLTEVALIATALLGVGLLYGRFERIAPPARPLLYATTGVFLLGLGLATASNHQLDAQIVAYHALWHLAGSFSFLFLWAFNHVRLTCGQL